MRARSMSSIKHKLTLIIMTISLTTLCLASGAIIFNDLTNFREELTRDLSTLAAIIGTNSVAAITFDDPADAERVLTGLAARKHIRAARIFDKSGNLFASYDAARAGQNLPSFYAGGSTHSIEREHIDLFHDVMLDGERVGTVFIQTDLGEFRSKLQRYAIILAVVLSISVLAAFLLTARLQKVITKPILELAQTARQVSEERDYSIRTKKQSEDEIGFLTDSFNGMLIQIQERDTALQTAHTKVEKQAEKLRRELRQRSRAESALRKSEERLRDLFDNAPDTYIILDPQGNIINFNRRGTHVLGYGFADIVGTSLLDIVADEDHDLVEGALLGIRNLGEVPKNIEVRLIAKDEKIVWVSKEFSLLRNDDDSLQSIRIICRDITDRKGLQDALDRARRLESAGRIAGQIAHDFNNLLGPLAAYPKLIRDDLPPNVPVIEMVNEMEHAAAKIAEINQQLLSLGRRGHYQMEPVDLNQLLDSVIVTQKIERRVQVEKDLATDLFPVKGGSAQLTRALTNLLLNACEATGRKGVLKVKTRNVYLDNSLRGYEKITPGEYAQLDIADNGCGIPPDILDKIFDPFFTTKRQDRIRGSGLGLSVVHGVIEDHKGYLTVESQVGTGTTFFVYLPLSRDVQLEVNEIIEEVTGGTESILIVDDDPVQRKVTAHLLKRLGYEANTVTSGEQAVEYIRKYPQDLLILDMVMEGIDGTETFKQILEFEPRQKAILLSGFAMSKRVHEALALGAGSFLSKPVSYLQLAKVVREQLDASKVEIIR